jgi:hypothetical protein
MTFKKLDHVFRPAIFKDNRPFHYQRSTSFRGESEREKKEARKRGRGRL